MPTTPAVDRKAWATVQAELVLGGWHAALIDGDDGRPLLVVSRWAMTRSFDDLTEAQRWANQVLGSSSLRRSAAPHEGDRHHGAT